MNMVFKIVFVIGCLIGIGLFVVILLVNDKNKCFKVYVMMWNFEKKGVFEE